MAPLYWNGLGNELGNGLGQFATNLIQTKTALEQQELERRKQEQDLQMRQQAADLQRQQFETGRADIDYNRQRQERLDGINDREGDFKTVLAPQMDTFMEGVNNDIARYAPTLKDGSANPQYSPALYQAATTRKKQALKLWSNVGLSVGHGENWEASKTGLLNFIGGDTPDPQQGQGVPAQSVKSDLSTSQPTAPQMMTVQGNDGASASFTLPGQPAPTTIAPPTQLQTAAPQAQASPTAQAAPTTGQQPAKSVTSLTGAELLDMTDDQLLQEYGQGGLEWGRAKRAAYIGQVQAQQAEAAKIRAKSWDTQLGELSKRPDLTGDQRLAIATISSLMAKPQLSDGEAKQMADSFALLTPKMYDATSWEKLLATKDPTTILAQLPVYQKYAPDVVQGFDPVPFQQAVNDAHDLTAAKTASEQAGAKKTGAEADAITQELPGKIANTAADTREKNANADKTVADAAGNRQKEVAGLLASFGSFPADMSYEQIAKQAGPAIQKIKDVLGIDDAGVANLIGQAQYKYSLGIKGEQLKNDLAQAKVETQIYQTKLTSVQTAAAGQKIVNDTAATNSAIAVNDSRTQANAAAAAAALAQARQTEALTPVKVAITAGQGAANIALTNARAGQAQAQTAVSWANVAKVKSTIDTDQRRTDAYVAGVKGKYVVDMAHAANLNSQTALNRAKNPNDPLYNPVVAASKPGDPIDALKKKANLYYTQADGALKTANTLQTQINSLVKQGTGVSGTFSKDRLSPADQKKLEGLTAQRDKLMQVAVNRRKTGDGVLSTGLAALTPKPKPAQAPPAQKAAVKPGGTPLPAVKPAAKPAAKPAPAPAVKPPTQSNAPLPRPALKGNYAKAGPVFETKLADAVKKKDGAAINYFANQLLNMGYKQADIERYVDKLAAGR